MLRLTKKSYHLIKFLEESSEILELKASRSLILILFLSIFIETFLNFSLLGSVFDVVHQASFFRGVILNFFWWNLANVFLVVVTVSLAFIEKERTIWRAKSISSMEK